MKISTTKGSWTSFWKTSGIKLGAKEKSQPLDRINKNTYLRLRRWGISREAFDYIRIGFGKYKYDGPVQMLSFVYLFTESPEIVMGWFQSEDYSQAVKRLFNLIKQSRRQKAKDKIQELRLLYKLFRRKRELTEYEVAYQHKLPLFSTNEFSQLFRLTTKRANFKCKIINFDGFKVFCISRKQGIRTEDEVYKYLFVKKTRGRVLIKLALDTPSEKGIILNHLTKKLGVLIEKPIQAKRLTKFTNFVKKGKSQNFVLTGADFKYQDARLSIHPRFGKPDNICQHQIYKEIINSGGMPLDMLEKIQINREGAKMRPPYTLALIAGGNTATIIGGIKISFDGRGLNMTQRQTFKKDFYNTFGLYLDTPIEYKVDVLDIYRHIFINRPKKGWSSEVGSDKVLEIANKFSKYGLLPITTSKEETPKICTDRQFCPKPFRPIWTNVSICPYCKGNLLPASYTIKTTAIPEERLQNALYDIAFNNGFEVKKLTDSLARRTIFPLEITKKNEKVCLIPITENLSDIQVELLKYRYPNCILITSKGDRQKLSSMGINEPQDLYEMMYRLFERSPKRYLNKLINEVESHIGSCLITLSKSSVLRLSKMRLYKTLGVYRYEFFEADLYILLRYIFRNSLWLGAKTRGKRYPDSVSAFPLDETNRGCFICDAKYSDTRTFKTGEKNKNEYYVKWGIGDSSVKACGKLKGFLFISNSDPAPKFLTRLFEIIGRRYLLGAYLNSRHVVFLFRHYKRWEDQLSRDYRKRNIFLSSMEKIFTKPTSYKKIDKFIIWTDTDIKRILRGCSIEYRKLGLTGLRS